jgi:hypothetical protein
VSDHFFIFQDCLELLFFVILVHVAAVYVHKIALKNWHRYVCAAGIGHAVVDYGDEHEIGNKSLSYALAPAAKARSQLDFRQTGRGPLLGSSCLSTQSSSPIIVSRSSSLQLLLGKELYHNQVGEGNESGRVAATACLFENAEEEQEQEQEQEVWSSAGGLERTNLEFEFPDSDADMQNVELEKRKSSATLLGDGCYEQHTCETWWKWCRGILWCMQAQQATALWSIALATALMGLVILGHQWEHERCQNQQLQLQLCSKDEKISHLTYQVVCLREAMLGHCRVPVLHSSSVYHTFWSLHQYMKCYITQLLYLHFLDLQRLIWGQVYIRVIDETTVQDQWERTTSG